VEAILFHEFSHYRDVIKSLIVGGNAVCSGGAVKVAVDLRATVQPVAAVYDRPTFTT